jgi:AcrR family transcriptional regulator
MSSIVTTSLRERIVEKSMQMFHHYGVNTVSADHICAEMGVSKRTFYQLFESKEQLIAVIATDEIDSIRERIAEVRQYGFNAVLEAMKLSELYLSYHSIRNPNFLRDVKKSYPDVWAMYEAYQEEYIRTVLMENIRKGKEEQYYWPDLDSMTTSRLWIDIAHINYGYSEVENSTLQHFIRGMLTPRGISEYLFWN